MMERKTLTWCSVCVLTALLWAPSALADAAIDLSGVPAELALPLGPGENVMITARVTGARPGHVWLARTADLRVRYMLTEVRTGTYQVNLADKAVTTILAAEDGTGQFRIFAELTTGKVVSSVPVAFKMTQHVREDPTIYVYVDGARKTFPPSWSPEWDCDTGHCYRYGRPSPGAVAAWAWRTRRKEASHWLEPATVRKIEVEFAADVLDPSAELRAGGKRWPAEDTSRADRLVIPITQTIKKAWREAGSLQVVCMHGAQEVRRVELKAAPARLELPDEGAELTIVQRRTRDLPGSDGYLKLHIGDITAGQVLVSVWTRDGEAIIDQRSLTPQDELTFDLGPNRYTLRLKKLTNLLAGDDFAVFQVAPAAEKEEDRENIHALLDVIEKADVTFIRNGEPMQPRQMAAHLRRKLEFAGQAIQTVDQFIERVAGFSWASGTDYLVKKPDGTEVKAREWLAEQARQLESAE